MVEKTVPKTAHPKGIGGVTGGLALRLESLTVEDRLEVKFNDHPLPWDQAQISFDGWAREQVAPLFWATYPNLSRRAENGGNQRRVCRLLFPGAAGQAASGNSPRSGAGCEASVEDRASRSDASA